MLSDWGCMNFFIGKILQVPYFPGTAAVKKKILKRDFLRSFFPKFALPVIGNYDPVSLQILCRKYESWLKTNLQKSLVMLNLSL